MNAGQGVTHEKPSTRHLTRLTKPSSVPPKRFPPLSPPHQPPVNTQPCPRVPKTIKNYNNDEISHLGKPCPRDTARPHEPHSLDRRPRSAGVSSQQYSPLPPQRDSQPTAAFDQIPPRAQTPDSPTLSVLTPTFSYHVSSLRVARQQAPGHHPGVARGVCHRTPMFSGPAAPTPPRLPLEYNGAAR